MPGEELEIQHPFFKKSTDAEGPEGLVGSDSRQACVSPSEREVTLHLQSQALTFPLETHADGLQFKYPHATGWDYLFKRIIFLSNCNQAIPKLLTRQLVFGHGILEPMRPGGNHMIQCHSEGEKCGREG